MKAGWDPCGSRSVTRSGLPYRSERYGNRSAGRSQGFPGVGRTRSLKQDSGNTEMNPDSILDFRLDIHAIPEIWPAESSFSADVEVLGSVLPNLNVQIRGETKENGDLAISVYKQADASADSVCILRCSGTLIPVEPQIVPAYNTSDLTRHFNVFSVNDKTVSEFSQKIRRPLITGILNFLDEVPASACQSVMDDMEEYGLLNLLLDEE